MARGDFILTPNWAPHDHGNPGKQPVMWLDVLDMPTVNHFETSFMEHFDEKAQNTNRANGDSLERYGSGVLPDGSMDTFPSAVRSSTTPTREPSRSSSA